MLLYRQAASDISDSSPSCLAAAACMSVRRLLRGVIEAEEDILRIYGARDEPLSGYWEQVAA